MLPLVKQPVVIAPLDERVAAYPPQSQPDNLVSPKEQIR
jgi:hypothetical protein